MTRFCVTGCERDVESLSQRLENLEPDDLCEIRIDALYDGASLGDAALEELWPLISKYGPRLIVTCRPEWQGGWFSGDEHRRLGLLVKAFELGARFVDVEVVALDELPSFVAHENILASWHGDIADLDKVVFPKDMHIKVAANVNWASDLVKLRRFSQTLKQPASVVAVGHAGIWSRVRPLDFNSAWTYVAAASGLETAAGQVTKDEAVALRALESGKLQPIALVGGKQVTSSVGPAVYNRLFSNTGESFQYLAVPARSWGEVLELTLEFGIPWLSVTMPFKKEAFASSLVSDTWALGAGVANTVQLKQGVPIKCWNTDVVGFLDGLPDAHSRALILGGGDTAFALAYGLRQRNVEVTFAARRVDVVKTRASSMDGVNVVTWQDRASVPFDLLIQATPLDGLLGEAPWDESGLKVLKDSAKLVVDVVVPVKEPTALVKDCWAAGIPVMDGLDFWAYQAARQASLFTGRDVTFKEIVATLNAVRRIDFKCLPESSLLIPGSKSLTQRYLVLSALSDVAAKIHNASTSSDSIELAAALQQFKTGQSNIYCGQGGTTARFMAALSLLTDRQICLEFASGLARRPMRHMADALALAGKQTKIVEERDGKGIFLISGPKFAGGRVSVDASVSSQFASGLLLVAPFLENGLELVIKGPLVSKSYLEMTLRSIKLFGASVIKADYGFKVPPSKPKNVELTVEPDWSLAAFWFVANKITGAGPVPDGLTYPSMQGDAIVCDLLQTIAGGECEIDLKSTPDLLPPLVIAAIFQPWSVTFTNVGHARYKESNRLEVLASELTKVGANITVLEDSMVIKPSILNGPAILNPHGDHRMAMSFGILSLALPKVFVTDKQCVSKSYPSFFNQLEVFRRLSKPPSALVLVGNRGSGKSTVGQALAATLGLDFIDTDVEVERRTGLEISQLFNQGRIGEFRRLESAIIRENLQKPVALATGGGALDDGNARWLLKNAFVAWLDCPVDVLVKRLGNRPSVTGADPAQELELLAKSRNEKYCELAIIKADTSGNNIKEVCDVIERAWRTFQDSYLR